MKRLAIFALIAGLLLTCLEQRVAASPGPEEVADLEKVIRDELKETHTPGAAVAIIRGGRTVFAKGFGVGNVETDAPITPETLFRLGSTTKMFTGAAALALAERGRVKLDAPIGQYVSNLPAKLSKVSLHQLLSHSAGVGDFSAPFISHDDSALATMVRGWKDDVMFGEPARVYSYSSPGYWLAGFVIESAGGKPYADVMDELLFKPIGMTRTTFRPQLAMTYPLSQGHNLQDGTKPTIIRPAFNNVAMWPAGSIFSNLTDLSRFVTALLSDGKLDGQQVLPSSMFRNLSGEHVSMPGDPATHYGYGLLNFEYRGVRLVMHGGFSRGYGSMIQMAPEQGFAVIVLTNKSGETLRKTTEKAKEIFLSLKPATHEEPKKAIETTAADLNRFVGTYVNGPQTKIEAEGGRLFLKNEGSREALTKTASDRFSFGKALDNDVAFVFGNDGNAEYIFTGLYSARRTAK